MKRGNFAGQPKFEIRDLTFRYDESEALSHVTLDIPSREMFVLFGPAQAGKSTLLRLLNRLNDLVDETRMEGEILLDGDDIYAPGYDVIGLRRRVGMVFALPIPLPGTIRENLTYGPRLSSIRDPQELEQRVRESLERAALWNEVKDRLDEPAADLSGGQQQRLCLARVLAMRSEVILLDDPTSGLDPLSTAKVEESLRRLREDHTIVMVPHGVQQAARIADRAAFMLDGELVEAGAAEELFTRPQDQRTSDYITGRFG
ncbi:MAG: phosphate ABC transporter ATP-binding protein [Chloroflexota bacterium]|nr:phosphate ABC transporter ATP-binding protein [Chloroflexota bacterium]